MFSNLWRLRTLEPSGRSILREVLAVGLLVLCSGVACVGQDLQLRNIYTLGWTLDGYPRPLVRSADGSLWTTITGGKKAWGHIIRLAPDASSYTRVYELGNASTNESVGFSGRLVSVQQDTVYAILHGPFTNVLFRIGTNGAGFTIVRDLPAAGAYLHASPDGYFYLLNGGRLERFSGQNPVSEVLYPNAPAFSQALEIGDSLVVPSGKSIFKIGKSGGGITEIATAEFGIVTLADGGNGRLYGSEDGFGQDLHHVFSVNYDGSDYKRIGSLPMSGFDGSLENLVDGGDGNLYGIYASGPGSWKCALVRVGKDGTAQFLQPLGSLPDDFNAPLTVGPNNQLLGSFRTGRGVIASVAKDGSGYTNLIRFSHLPGAFVQSALTYGGDGRIYGAAARGGDGDRGMIFSLLPDGSDFTPLKVFGSVAQGMNPRGGVIAGTDGALYGTTQNGGTNGGGTLFRMNKDGTDFTTLMHFGSTTGTNPTAMLLEGSDGLLYGSCINGGTGQTNGTLWRIQKNGQGFGVLKAFAGSGAEGRRPFAALTEGVDGWLYGTTDNGGSNARGVVFKMQKDGSGFEVLRSLTGFGDAAFPQGKLVQTPDGRLLGTSSGGGTAGLGAIWTIQTNGAGYRVLYSFLASNSDGRVPIGGLVPVGDGTYLGTTRYGGGQAVGTVYRISGDGSNYSVVHRFGTSPPSGMEPWAALTAGPAGSFFGVTTLVVDSSGGQIFKMETPGSVVPPSIALGFSGSTFEITWPEIYADYELQKTISVTGGWQPVIPPPSATGGLFRYSGVAGSGPGEYFRLKKK